MPPTVYLNGEFLDADDARVSAFDAGLTHGVGLFETFLVIPPSDPGGSPRGHRIMEHLNRLADSARQLGLFERLGVEPLAEAVLHTVDRSGLVAEGARARVRVTLTGGALNLLERPTAQARGTEANTDQNTNTRHAPAILIVPQAATPYPDEMFDRGVGAIVADARLNPLNPHESHKTLSYWLRLRALQGAATKGASEAILLQVSNHVAGGTISNLIAVTGDRVISPTVRGEEPSGAIPSPILPGVTRAAILDHARSRGMEIETRLMTIDDALDADELMLTNSSWGVLPVVRVESRRIGSGEPGRITRVLREAWLEELA